MMAWRAMAALACVASSHAQTVILSATSVQPCPITLPFAALGDAFLASSFVVTSPAAVSVASASLWLSLAGNPLTGVSVGLYASSTTACGPTGVSPCPDLAQPLGPTATLAQLGGPFDHHRDVCVTACSVAQHASVARALCNVPRRAASDGVRHCHRHDACDGGSCAVRPHPAAAQVSGRRWRVVADGWRAHDPLQCVYPCRCNAVAFVVTHAVAVAHLRHRACPAHRRGDRLARGVA